MSTQHNQLNFEDQPFYIGIDAHKNNWKITIRTNERELKTFSMNPSPKQLSVYMNKHYPGGSYYSVYEAGFCGFWIHRELEKLGFKNIITNPADVPTKQKEKINKSDPIDSRKLARELEHGSLDGIYIPDEFHQHLRSLMRLRYRMVQNQTRVKNRIKSMLYFYGIDIPEQFQGRCWSGAFIEWLSSLQFRYDCGNETLHFCLDELNYFRVKLAQILKSLRNYAYQSPIQAQFRAIKSVSGIGFITAMTLYTEIINMNRFKNLDHLASFVGLIPSGRSSGDTHSEEKLTSRYNKQLRYLLVEAAWTAIREDPAMTMKYNQLLKRMGKQKAIIHIAKKLLNRIRYVWKNNKMYVKAIMK